MTRARTLYICGSGHSGSTLLEMMLAGHSRMTAIGEIVNLSHQIAIGRPCGCGRVPPDCPRWQAVRDAVREKSGVDLLMEPYRFRVSRERPRNTWEAALRMWNRGCMYAAAGSVLGHAGIARLAIGQPAMAANARLVTAAFREAAGAEVLVESSKDYLRMREVYDGAPPGETKVIYLTRDGRGCVWAGVRRGHGTTGFCAGEWVKNQRRTRAMLAGLAADDWMHLRYEELCLEPKAALTRVCELVGLDYEDAMLALSPREHHTIAGNKIRTQRAMTLRLDEAWRQQLTAGQIAEFEAIAGDENRRLGYGEGPAATVASTP